MTRATRIMSAVVVAVLVLTGVAGAAGAAPAPDLANGGNPPGGWVVDESIYNTMFGSMEAGAPQGTLIADSGFRPYPHGFPIPNWGSAQDLASSSLVFGIPERLTLTQIQKGEYRDPPPLNSLALRRALGDGVCRDAKAIDPKTGACDLILGATLLAQSIESAGLGGHCLGIAAAAAALYNGQLPANQVGASGLGINAANPMDDRAIQTITRLFGTQYLNPDMLDQVKEGQSPTEVVQTLINTLPSGQVPFVLTLYGTGGGHGITPYAVLDRGNGLYDIAVYDNNYPFRALTLTIDTVANTFVYTSATNPNSPNYTWSTANDSAIALIPLDDILAVQPCPVCRGEDEGTLVAFSSWSIANQGLIDIGLTDLQGAALAEDLYRLLNPLNPSTGKQQSAPLIVVDPGVDFAVAVQTGALAAKQSMEVYAMSNGASDVLTVDQLRSNDVFRFFVSDTSTAFMSTQPSSPRIENVQDAKLDSYSVIGHPLSLPAGIYVSQENNRDAKTVKFKSTAKKTLEWNVQVVQNPTPTESGWAGLSVDVPAGGTILVDYGKTTATVPPLAWVLSKSKDRTPIKMVKVTPALLLQQAKDVYTAYGPS
ncbi:hypothetical protein LBMAG15_15740 [Actinomycetes bacterium]|nr:hypothetical protein LBMAG15_15740 [Actinomycetes bacterium]